MDSTFKKKELYRCRGNTLTMCEFHESTCKGFGDIWWTDNPIYFSSIDYTALLVKILHVLVVLVISPLVFREDIHGHNYVFSVLS